MVRELEEFLSFHPDSNLVAEVRSSIAAARTP